MNNSAMAWDHNKIEQSSNRSVGDLQQLEGAICLFRLTLRSHSSVSKVLSEIVVNPCLHFFYFHTMNLRLLVFSLICMHYGVNAQLLPKRKAHKEVKAFLDSFCTIEAGEYRLGVGPLIMPVLTDTAMLFTKPVEIVKLNQYHIAQHEVTNGEYRAFRNWVIDSLKRDLFVQNGYDEFCLPKNGDRFDAFNPKGYRINWDTRIDMENEEIFDLIQSEIYLTSDERFYSRLEIDARKVRYRYLDFRGVEKVLSVQPDTAVWNAEWGIFYEPIAELYFWHPAYSNYPVVGVRLEQAEAYAHWKTQRIREAARMSGQSSSIIGQLRVPTESEWEAAAMPRALTDTLCAIRALYPEIFEMVTARGCPLANLGFVTDDQGILVRDRESDGAEISQEVGFFYVNQNGVHDMVGNVSEWTSTDAQQDHFSLRNPIWSTWYFWTVNVVIPANSCTSEETILEWVSIHLPELSEAMIKYEHVADDVREAARSIVHDARVASTLQESVFVKGGNWHTGYAAAFPASRWARNPNIVSSRIGFRLVWSE